jgi:predicted O-methyltransferase YrrM
MRAFAHVTPRYVLARCREAIDQTLHPDDPWLARHAIELLKQLLRPVDEGLEFGAGRSTVWFAVRVAKLTSVEDNADWHRRVRERLSELGLSNVEVRHCPRDATEDERAASSAYVRVIEEFADESLDFVLVDGIYRSHCATGATAKVRPGGLIVIDNVHWFLPSASRTPTARRLQDGPADSVWQQFLDRTSSWRRIWTTSGVIDTLIIFKP